MTKNTSTQLGVWLDQSKAYLVVYYKGKASFLEEVESPYDRKFREEGEGSDHTRFGPSLPYTSNNENKKHNIAKNEMKAYFSSLEDKLLGYDDILLLGPGTAKDRLRKRLAENNAFSTTRVFIKTSDKMTENQLLAYIREFFDSK